MPSEDINLNPVTIAKYLEGADLIDSSAFNGL